MGKLKSYQEQVQEIIEKSINAVEEQHKALAQKPFELAEKVEAEAKSFSVESIRNAHNEYVATLYTTLREWNKRLGNLAGDLIARVEQEQAAESVEAAEPAKKAAPRKAAKKAEAVEAEAETA